MNSKKFVYILAALALGLSACKKYPEYCRGGMRHEFDMEVSISPATDIDGFVNLAKNFRLN